MDGKRILLDGVCNQVPPYMGTPDEIRQDLSVNFPDVLAFTHEHEDHYDSSFAQEYQNRTGRIVYGPAEMSEQKIGENLFLQAVPTRHIGKTTVPHVSFVLRGSCCVWFMGDASPLVLKEMREFPKPDVLIAPYAYALTASAWRSVKELGAKEIIILHLPLQKEDEFGLWQGVEQTTKHESHLCIPQIGHDESILLIAN